MVSAARFGFSFLPAALSAALLSLPITACGSSGEDDDDGINDFPDANPSDFVVSGTVMGTDARAGDFNGLFTNEDNVGSLHVYGLGRSTDGASFRLNLPSSLPMEAQNGGTVAVGHIVMTELDDSIPEGRPSSSDGEKIIGVSTDHMLVYRAAPFVTVYAWEDAFPAGWGCGVCQRGAPGQRDQLMVASCETLVINMGGFGSQDSCNPFAQ